MPISLTATIIVCSFLVGGLLNFPLSLFPTWKRLFGWSDGRFLAVQWIFYLSLGVLLVVSGLVVNFWGPFETILFGCLIGAFGLASLAVNVPGNATPNPPVTVTEPGKEALPPALAPPPRGFALVVSSLVMLAAATAFLHTSTAVSMPNAFFPDAVDNPLTPEIEVPATETRVPAATNLGYIFVGLGFLLGPVLKKLLLENLNPRSGLLLMALLFLIPAVTALVATKEVFPRADPEPAFAALFSNVDLWTAVVCVFFLYALESALVFWTPKYLDELGFSGRGKWLIWAGFWTCFFLGRGMCATFVGALGFYWVLVLAAFLVGITLGNMAGLSRQNTGTLSFLFLGFCMGPIFPTLAGLIFLNFPTQMAVSFGIICGLGTVGRLLFEPLIESQVQKDRLWFAMVLTMIMALLVAIPGLVLLVIE